jgi:hypothetical protein
MPYNPYIIDGTTFINPIGLAFTLLMGILVLALPRRYALLPVIILTCYMTIGMRVMVAEHQANHQEHLRHIYLLISFELWHQQFVRTPGTTVAMQARSIP